MYNGIDVSKHNGTIDWAKVKSAGIDFAMIRAGYGSNIKQKDPLFDYNVTEAQANGVHCGAYWFSYAMCAEDAVREAKLFLEVVKPYNLTYPLGFDFEYDSVRYANDSGVEITEWLASEIADAFMTIVQNAGYYVVNYTNNDYINRYFNAEVVNKYELWLAIWSKTKPSRVTGIWQYAVLGSEEDVKAGRATVVGSVPGVPGTIDVDYCYKDYPSIIAAMTANETLAETINITASNTEEGEDNMTRYNKLSDIPNDYQFRDIIEMLMNAEIINGDGSDKAGNNDVIDLSHDQVRTIVFEYRGGAFDRALIAKGMTPAVEV